MGAWCQSCGAEWTYKPSDVVGRIDTCPKCGVDAHACIHCAHYDPRAYNACKEPQAERVDDRTKSNFCDYFRLKPTKPGATGPAVDKNAAARAKLEGLFKKPGT
jgi:hypothetical protein